MRMAAISVLLASAGTALAGGDAVLYLTLLHNNDGESQLIDAGGTQSDYGGIARFATVVDNLRDDAATLPPGEFQRVNMLISSGDNFLAGPEFNASLDKGVPFYDTIGMDLIGYTTSAIGNHEFDLGPDILADFIIGFGGATPFLSANLDFSAEQNLQDLVDLGDIASSALYDFDGTLVGIVGATTPNLNFISSPGEVVVDQDVAGAVQAEVDALNNAGAQIIILTSHLQGINEDIQLIGQISGVDIVVAGGGDELLANEDDVLIPGDEPATDNEGELLGYPLLVEDADLESVPVITTAGSYKYVGRLIVGFDADGNVVDILDESGPVRVSGTGDDAVDPDPDVQEQVVDPVVEAVEDLANNIIATSEVDLDGIRNNIRSKETNEGNLVADALLWQANELAADFMAPDADVALQNGGGVRNDSIIPAGDFTELDTFDILPFSNFVTIVEEISPDQFKLIMENAVSRVLGDSGTGRFAQIAGFTMTYDISAQALVLDQDGNVVVPGQRVIDITLDDGSIIVENGMVNGKADDLNVATINFLATGGDQYPFGDSEFTILGVSYQLALKNFVETELEGVISAADYPEGGEGRIVNICYADFNGDGELNILDFVQFQLAFVDGDMATDCNGDGMLDILDFACFQQTFQFGCP